MPKHLNKKQKELYVLINEILEELCGCEKDSIDLEDDDAELVESSVVQKMAKIHSKGVLMLFAVIDTTDEIQLKELEDWIHHLRSANVTEDYSHVKGFEFPTARPVKPPKK